MKKNNAVNRETTKEMLNPDFAIIDEYFANGYNCTKAVQKIKPHVTYGSAKVIAVNVLKNEKNRQYIARKRHELSLEANITINQLVRNLGLIANADIKDYVGITERELKKLPFELSYPIKTMTTRTKTLLSNTGEPVGEETTVTYELKDSIKAIDMIGKHLGIYEMHNQQKQRTIDLTKATPDQLNAVLMLLEQQRDININE